LIFVSFGLPHECGSFFAGDLGTVLFAWVFSRERTVLFACSAASANDPKKLSPRSKAADMPWNQEFAASAIDPMTHFA